MDNLRDRDGFDAVVQSFFRPSAPSPAGTGAVCPLCLVNPARRNARDGRCLSCRRSEWLYPVNHAGRPARNSRAIPPAELPVWAYV